MSDTGRGFLRLTALLGAVLSVCLILSACEKKESGEKPEETDDSPSETAVFTVNSAEIVNLSWTAGDKSYSFSRAGEGWIYDEDPTSPANSELLDEMAHDVSVITASRVFPDVEDLAEFGLAEPVCSITVTAGESRIFLFGNTTATDRTRCYCTDGSGSVYIVKNDVCASFLDDPETADAE